MSEWQPIETAPKDGTFIDLWLTDGDRGWRVTSAYWGVPSWDGDDIQTEGLPQCWCTEDFIRDWDELIYGNAPLSYQPTHWMPLPQPPK